jgi:hypothetical protein
MDLLAVAASTGGPWPSAMFLSALPPLDVPAVITQHMPPEFTRLLAERLAATGGRPCREARDGEVLRAGHVYVAPGDHHLRVSVAGRTWSCGSRRTRRQPLPPGRGPDVRLGGRGVRAGDAGRGAHGHGVRRPRRRGGGWCGPAAAC